MLQHMFHVFVCLGKQIGHTNRRRDPHKPGIRHFHLMDPVKQIQRGYAYKGGNAIKHQSALLRHRR